MIRVQSEPCQNFEYTSKCLTDLRTVVSHAYPAGLYGVTGEDNPLVIIDELRERLHHALSATAAVNRIHRIMTDQSHDRSDLLEVALTLGVIEDMDDCDTSDDDLRTVIREHYS